MICWFHLDEFPWVGWLGHMVYLYSDIWGFCILSSIMVTLVYIPTSSGLEYVFHYTLQHLVLSDFWMITIPTGMKWNVIVILISISCWLMSMRIFSCFHLNFFFFLHYYYFMIQFLMFWDLPYPSHQISYSQILILSILLQ